jgi:hypothetical protein
MRDERLGWPEGGGCASEKGMKAWFSFSNFCACAAAAALDAKVALKSVATSTVRWGGGGGVRGAAAEARRGRTEAIRGGDSGAGGATRLGVLGKERVRAVGGFFVPS